MTENLAIFDARHGAGSFHPHRQPAPTAQDCLTRGNGANCERTLFGLASDGLSGPSLGEQVSGRDGNKEDVKMRKSFMLICAGLIVVVTAAQSYAQGTGFGKQTREACLQKCAADQMACIKAAERTPGRGSTEYEGAVDKCNDQNVKCSNKC
jgi:hypothetical protein